MESRSIDPLRVYNVDEAAGILGINSQTLLDYLREGKIVGQKIGEWKILGQNLVNFLSVAQETIDKVEKENREKAEKWRIGK